MKNLLLVSAFATLVSINVCGQADKDLPAVVKSAFTQKFPSSTSVKWGKEGDNEWEAEFKMGGKEYSANFDNKGQWLETEYEISESEIPTAVKASLDKQFASFKISESEISETVKGKFYEFEIKNGAEKKEVSIDMSGTIIKTEAEKEGDEEDKD